MQIFSTTRVGVFISTTLCYDVGIMLQLLIYDLKTIPSHERQLLWTLERFNNACEFVANQADKQSVYRLFAMSKKYRGIVQKKFKLGSGITECVIQRVAHDYRVLNAGRRDIDKIVPTYESNTWITCRNNTVSVTMPTIHVGHPLDNYPTRVSIATCKGRIKVPFTARYHPLDNQNEWKKWESHLILKDGKWSLAVAVEVGE